MSSGTVAGFAYSPMLISAPRIRACRNCCANSSPAAASKDVVTLGITTIEAKQFVMVDEQ